MWNLENKVTVITGAARGLGRAYAVAFARAGAQVVLTDLDACEETAADLDSVGATWMDVLCDVSQAEQTQALAERALNRFGKVDVLVNNAAMWGNLTFGPFHSIPEEEWDQTMAVNVKGLWNMAKAVAPSMKTAGGGSIINIASVAAKYGMAYGLHYTTSKAAVIGLTRGLARELGRSKIRVNAVAPNVVPNDAAGEFFGDKLSKLLTITQSQQALPDHLEPEDVVGTVLYLASDASRAVTGQTLMVDGGTILS